MHSYKLVCLPSSGGSSLGMLPPSAFLASLPTFSLATASQSQAGITSSVISPLQSVPLTNSSLTNLATTTLIPLPSKLTKRICDLQFIDMSELVPDSWRFQDDDQNKCCHQPRRHRRGPVTDILLWVECYSTLVSVLSAKYPHKAPEFMAYLKTIVRAQRSFYGEGWVTYDMCYRRQAAASRSLNWGQVDFTLYNEAFVGRAKSLIRCRYCSSEHHASKECEFAPTSEAPRQEIRTRSATRVQYDGRASPQIQICLLFNHRDGNQCRYRQCKFAHIFCECNGSHPLKDCHRIRPPPAKAPRVTSPVSTKTLRVE